MNQGVISPWISHLNINCKITNLLLIDGGSTDPIINIDYREKWPDVGKLMRQKLRKTCTRQLIFNRLPVIGWARGYRWSYVYHDFVAGLTVGLTAIPQGIAYAVVAGLEPQVNLHLKPIFIFISICYFAVRIIRRATRQLHLLHTGK